MTAQEREAMRLAYHEIRKLVNSGATTSQSTVDACVALRQALSPPCAIEKLRQLWKNIIQNRQRDETW